MKAHRSEGRDEEWVWGLHPVAEALEAGRPLGVLFRAREERDPRLKPLVAAAERRGVAVVRVPRTKLDELAHGRSHQGIAARVSPVELLAVSDWLERTRARAGSRVLVALDRVTDEGNAGAIVRSAAAFGADGILLPLSGSVRPGAGLARTSSGGLERVAIVRAAALHPALDSLRGAGFRVLAAVVDGGRPLAASDQRGDRVLVLGSESRGIRSGLLTAADSAVTVATLPGFPALNVSAAAAILLAWLLRAVPSPQLDSHDTLG